LRWRFGFGLDAGSEAERRRGLGIRESQREGCAMRGREEVEMLRDWVGRVSWVRDDVRVRRVRSVSGWLSMVCVLRNWRYVVGERRSWRRKSEESIVGAIVGS
jgi:hypothetical protein